MLNSTPPPGKKLSTSPNFWQTRIYGRTIALFTFLVLFSLFSSLVRVRRVFTPWLKAKSTRRKRPLRLSRCNVLEAFFYSHLLAWFCSQVFSFAHHSSLWINLSLLLSWIKLPSYFFLMHWLWFSTNVFALYPS